MDISTEIAALEGASTGAAVRQTIISALNKINSGTLPEVTSADAGKILKVGADGWTVGSKAGYIPVVPGSEAVLSFIGSATVDPDYVIPEMRSSFALSCLSWTASAQEEIAGGE